MKKNLLIASIIVLLSILVWGFINPNGIRAAYANNLWSIDFVSAYFTNPDRLSQLSQPPVTHEHAGIFQVKQALLQRDLDAALKYIEPLTGSGDSVILGIYAQVLYQQEKYAEAFEVWETTGDTASLWRAAGEMREIGREDLRLSTAKSLFNIDQEQNVSFYAGTLREGNDTPQAIIILSDAIRKYPQSQHKSQWEKMLSDSYTELAKARQNGKQWYEAEILFLQAIELQNENWLAWKYLGWIYYDRDHDVERAMECFTNVTKIVPESGEGYNDIGDILVKEKQTTRAIDWYKQIADKFPDITRFRLTYANLLRDTGQLTAAIDNYQSVIEQMPKEAWAHYELTLAYSMNDQPDEAILSINEAINIRDDVPSYHTLAGQVYEQAGYMEKALEAYKKALNLDPDNAWVIEAIERLTS